MRYRNKIEKLVHKQILVHKADALAKVEFLKNTLLDNKDYKDCYNTIRTLEFESSKLNNKSNEFIDLHNKITTHKIELDNLLKKYGYSQKDLLPQFNCTKCHDEAILNNQWCTCYKKRLSEYLLHISGVNTKQLPQFKDSNINLFKEDAKVEIEKIYKKMEEYTNKLENTKHKVVTLIGKTGVGKTFLAECMIQNAIKNAYYTIYTTAFAINNDFLSYQLAPVEQKQEILSKYLDCDFLVIDDLGTEPRLNNITEEYFYIILNERISNNKNILITTNLSLDQIQDVYGDRIFSRIANQHKCVLINMRGQDLRIKKVS